MGALATTLNRAPACASTSELYGPSCRGGRPPADTCAKSPQPTSLARRECAMQFDRHGARVWHQAKAFQDAERLRRGVGEAAVPYGLCTEPSNVQADGTSCPLRFRCLGCKSSAPTCPTCLTLRHTSPTCCAVASASWPWPPPTSGRRPRHSPHKKRLRADLRPVRPTPCLRRGRRGTRPADRRPLENRGRADPGRRRRRVRGAPRRAPGPHRRVRHQRPRRDRRAPGRPPTRSASECRTTAHSSVTTG